MNTIDPYLAYDTETYQNDRAPAYYLAKKYDAPANYKDPVKIEEAIREKRAADMSRAALSWWTARLTCITAYPLNGIGDTLAPGFFSHDDEKVLLTQFFNYVTDLEERTSNRLILCGKRSDDFDQPMIVGRALVHDIGIPDSFRIWRKLTDVELIFGATSQASSRGRLYDYAWGLDIPNKLGTGFGAIELWLRHLTGDTDAQTELVGYCAQDSLIVKEILRRYLKRFVPTVAIGANPEAFEVPFGGPV